MRFRDLLLFIFVLVVISADSTAADAGPVFVTPVGNQTAAIGREAIFSCSVRNIGKYKVGWLRTSDQTILSMHTRTVTHNARIAVTFESGGSPGVGGAGGATGNGGRGLSKQHGVTGSSHVPEEAVNGTWQLHIRQLKESDRGCYMCQINTRPMKSSLGCLDILGGNSFGEYQNFSGSLLQFHRVDRRQMGVYMCIASNDVPPAVSKRVTLAVNFAPVVTASEQLLGAPLGTNVTLMCDVEAHPKPINYWEKNTREMLLEGSKYSISEVVSGYKITMILLVKDFTLEDCAGYRCLSRNSVGTADGAVRLYKLDLDTAKISRGKNPASIIGGLAEAARGTAGSSTRAFESSSVTNITYALGAVLLLLQTLCPR